MVECSNRSCLLLKTRTALFDALDRDDSIESSIARRPHFSHAAFTKQREDFVRTKAGTRSQRHLRSARIIRAAAPRDACGSAACEIGLTTACSCSDVSASIAPVGSVTVRSLPRQDRRE